MMLDDPFQALCQALFSARRRHGLSQAAASLACGFSAPYLGMIERGRRRPGPRALLRMQEVLGLDPVLIRSLLGDEWVEAGGPQPLYPDIRRLLVQACGVPYLAEEIQRVPWHLMEEVVCASLVGRWRSARRRGWQPPAPLSAWEALLGGTSARRIPSLLARLEGVAGQEPPGPFVALEEWGYNREEMRLELKLRFPGRTPETEVVGTGFLLGLEEGPGAGDHPESLRRALLRPSRLSRLPEGLQGVVQDEALFLRWQPSEAEIDYLVARSADLRAGRASRAAYISELKRLRARGGGEPEAALPGRVTVRASREPSLYRLVAALLTLDEGLQERLVPHLLGLLESLRSFAPNSREPPGTA